MLMSEVQIIHNLIESKELLVFDFDGVLADSVEVKTKAFADIYSPYGECIVSKVVNHHRMNGGMSRFDKFNYYHSAFLGMNITDSQVSKLSEQFSSLVINAVIAAPEISGANTFLQNYCINNKKCVINSATPHDEICYIVEQRGMNKYFSNIYGSPSTKYENLQLALDNNRTGNKEAIFFGDAESDLTAAIKADISFIGVGDLVYSLQKNMEALTYHINNFGDISK